MKKLGIICVALLLASGVAFTQAQPAGFTNTIYTDYGTANINGDGMTHGNKTASHNGFIDHFTAYIYTNKVDVSGDITWKFLDGFNLQANFINSNFNGTMRPFEGIDIGFGTNLDWEIGPEPFSGPEYSAYDTPYYAGLKILGNSVGYVRNYFAQKSIAIRYSYQNKFSAGMAVNGDGTKSIGAWGNLDSFTIGFSYNGNFGNTGNNYYLGSQLFLDAANVDLWLNHAQNYNTTFGGRLEFYSPTMAYFYAPEFSITMWDQENKGMSMYISFLGEMSISREILAGLNASLGAGSDPNTTTEYNDGGSRLNVTPHLVWNISESQRFSVAVNFAQVWWQNGKSDFYWNIPISWRVEF